MATAIFNQEINASSVKGDYNSYELTEVITRSGFDEKSLGFRINSSPSDDIYIEDNTKLFVGYGVYGDLTINVYDKSDNSVNVSTNIKKSYGYFYERYFSEGSNPENSKKVVNDQWSTIINGA